MHARITDMQTQLREAVEATSGVRKDLEAAKRQRDELIVQAGKEVEPDQSKALEAILQPLAELAKLPGLQVLGQVAAQFEQAKPLVAAALQAQAAAEMA
eukprot:9839745-Alexandrium_andersonii.AAC.1